MAEVKRTVGWFELVGCWVLFLFFKFSLHRFFFFLAAVLRLSHVLSHGVAMFGGLVGGGGL